MSSLAGIGGGKGDTGKTKVMNGTLESKRLGLVSQLSELRGFEGDVSPSWGLYKGAGPLRRNR